MLRFLRFSLAGTCVLVSACSTPASVSEDRVETLENQVTALQAQLTTATGTIGTLQTTQAELVTRLEAAEQKLDAPAPKVLAAAVVFDSDGTGLQASDVQAALAEVASTASGAQTATASLSEEVIALGAKATETATALTAVEMSHQSLAKATDPALVACPNGMEEVEVGGYCIDKEPREAGPHFFALNACVEEGAHLCTPQEWQRGCFDDLLAGIAGLELADDYFDIGESILMDQAENCIYASPEKAENGASYPYRCCRDKSSLVYGFKG